MVTPTHTHTQIVYTNIYTITVEGDPYILILKRTHEHVRILAERTAISYKRMVIVRATTTYKANNFNHKSNDDISPKKRKYKRKEEDVSKIYVEVMCYI